MWTKNAIFHKWKINLDSREDAQSVRATLNPGTCLIETADGEMENGKLKKVARGEIDVTITEAMPKAKAEIIAETTTVTIIAATTLTEQEMIMTDVIQTIEEMLTQIKNFSFAICQKVWRLLK